MSSPFRIAIAIAIFAPTGGVNFSNAMGSERRSMMAVEFHNTGLYNLAGILSSRDEHGGSMK